MRPAQAECGRARPGRGRRRNQSAFGTARGRRAVSATLGLCLTRNRARARPGLGPAAVPTSSAAEAARSHTGYRAGLCAAARRRRRPAGGPPLIRLPVSAEAQAGPGRARGTAGLADHSVSESVAATTSPVSQCVRTQGHGQSMPCGHGNGPRSRPTAHGHGPCSRLTATATAHGDRRRPRRNLQLSSSAGVTAESRASSCAAQSESVTARRWHSSSVQRSGTGSRGLAVNLGVLFGIISSISSLV